MSRARFLGRRDAVDPEASALSSACWTRPSFYRKMAAKRSVSTRRGCGRPARHGRSPLIRCSTMPAERRIRDLLADLLEPARTPEEVCVDYPELLPVLRARWVEVRRVKSAIDDLFPTSPGLPLSDPILEGP